MNVHSHLRDTYGAWQAFNSQLLRDLGGARTENPYEVTPPPGLILHFYETSIIFVWKKKITST